MGMCVCIITFKFIICEDIEAALMKPPVKLWIMCESSHLRLVQPLSVLCWLFYVQENMIQAEN